MASIKKLISPNLVLGILLVGSFGFSAYTYSLYRKSIGEFQKIKTDSGSAQQAAANEAQSLVTEVGKLVILPEGTPTVATVTDAEKLKKDQPFFKNAQNGYKILVYEKKAYLYDPVNKKIVEVAPVNSSSKATASSSPKPSPSR